MIAFASWLCEHYKRARAQGIELGPITEFEWRLVELEGGK
jgi:hypothetical protein